MIEDDFIDKDYSIVSPVPAMRTVSHDPTLPRARSSSPSGGTVHRGRPAVGVPPPRAEVRRRRRPRGVRRRGRRPRGPRSLGGHARRRSSATRARSTASSTGSRSSTCSTRTSSATRLEWDDPKLALLDLQYHDVRPERSLYERLVRAGKVERLVTEDDVDAAMTEPPEHPGVLPRTVPGRVARRGRRRQLGQSHPRRGHRPAAADPDDGAPARNAGPRRGVVRGVHDPGRAGGPAGVVGGQRCPNANASRSPAPKKRVEEDVEDLAPAKQGEKIKEELDDLLDEIDSVLEENAEDFVKSYVQKGASEIGHRRGVR